MICKLHLTELTLIAIVETQCMFVATSHLGESSVAEWTLVWQLDRVEVNQMRTCARLVELFLTNRALEHVLTVGKEFFHELIAIEKILLLWCRWRRRWCDLSDADNLTVALLVDILLGGKVRCEKHIVEMNVNVFRFTGDFDVEEMYSFHVFGEL